MERCWNCRGSGTVQSMGMDRPGQCSICGGTGFSASASNPYQAGAMPVLQLLVEAVTPVLLLLFKAFFQITVLIVESKLFKIITSMVLKILFRVLYYVSLAFIFYNVFNWLFKHEVRAGIVTLVVYSVAGLYVYSTYLADGNPSDLIDSVNEYISEYNLAPGTLSILNDRLDEKDFRFVVYKNMPPQFILKDIPLIHVDEQPDMFDVIVRVQPQQTIYKATTYDIPYLKKWVGDIDGLDMSLNKVSVYTTYEKGSQQDFRINVKVYRGNIFWEMEPNELSKEFKRLGLEVQVDSPILQNSALGKRLIKANQRAHQAKREKKLKEAQAYGGLWKGKFICDQRTGDIQVRINISANGNMTAIERYHPLPGFSGSFTSAGKVIRDGSFYLKFKTWIKRPVLRFSSTTFTAPVITGHANASFTKIEGSYDREFCKSSSLSLVKQ